MNDAKEKQRLAVEIGARSRHTCEQLVVLVELIEPRVDRHALDRGADLLPRLSVGLNFQAAATREYREPERKYEKGRRLHLGR